MCKKIGIVVTQYEAGGAQKAAVNLANGLSRAGHEVTLIFFYKKADAAFYLDQDVKLVFLKDEVGSKIGMMALTLPRLVRALRKRNIGCAVSFTHYANIYTALAARIVSIPAIVSHRNPLFSYGTITRAMDGILYRFGFYPIVTYVSNAVKDSFSEHYQDQEKSHVVIYNCVDGGDEVSEEKAPIISQGSCSSPAPYIISVGRLTPQKNHALLIRSLSLSDFNGSLIILGDGECKESLQELAEQLGVLDKVKFMGVIGNNEVLQLLRGAEAFFMPSLYEGMSNALLEAIVNNIHTVVSNVPAQVEAVSIQGHVYGNIVDINDTAAWASAMTEISEGKPVINDSVAKMLKERYSFKRYIDDFSRLLGD